MRNNTTAEPRFLDRKQAAQYIKLSDFWLEKHCNDHTGPKWFRHGRKCWYRRVDLDAWLAERQRERGDAPSVWRTSEARQVLPPKDEALEQAYVEEWGADEPANSKSAEEELKAVLVKLTVPQIKAMARALMRTAELL